jgi:hypothetical protein
MPRLRSGWLQLLQLTEGEDAAAVGLHYLRDGSVAATVLLFEDRGMQHMLDELAAQFGACSVEGVTKWQWIDPA